MYRVHRGNHDVCVDCNVHALVSKSIHVQSSSCCFKYCCKHFCTEIQMCTVKSVRARYAKLFNDSDDDTPVSPFDVKERNVPDVSETTASHQERIDRPSTPEHWPTSNYPTMQCVWMPVAAVPVAAVRTATSADTCSASAEHQGSGTNGKTWRPKQDGWHSRRHQYKCEEVGGGSDSKQNSWKTSSNTKKKEKKDRKAEEAGQMTRAQKRAAERSN